MTGDSGKPHWNAHDPGPVLGQCQLLTDVKSIPWEAADDASGSQVPATYLHRDLDYIPSSWLWPSHVQVGADSEKPVDESSYLCLSHKPGNNYLLKTMFKMWKIIILQNE